ncbi:MAG: hypothetical protein WA692_11230, partial [Paraburkholderia caledonica]
ITEDVVCEAKSRVSNAASMYFGGRVDHIAADVAARERHSDSERGCVTEQIEGPDVAERQQVELGLHTRNR